MSVLIPVFAAVTTVVMPQFTGMTNAQQTTLKTPEELIRKIYTLHQRPGGKEFLLGKESLLAQYFDKDLTQLFIKFSECSQNGGRNCNWDFDPFIHSNGGFSKEGFFNFNFRRLNSNPDVIIEVTFNYISAVRLRKVTQKVIYYARMTNEGWRISDIVHSGSSGKFSIKSFLSQSVR